MIASAWGEAPQLQTVTLNGMLAGTQADADEATLVVLAIVNGLQNSKSIG